MASRDFQERLMQQADDVIRQQAATIRELNEAQNKATKIISGGGKSITVKEEDLQAQWPSTYEPEAPHKWVEQLLDSGTMTADAAALRGNVVPSTGVDWEQDYRTVQLVDRVQNQCDLLDHKDAKVKRLQRDIVIYRRMVWLLIFGTVLSMVMVVF